MTNHNIARKKRGLEEHLSDQIRKSGHPLEIELSLILEKDWVIENNSPFRDPDEGKLRSVDIKAWHFKKLQSNECKPLSF